MWALLQDHDEVDQARRSSGVDQLLLMFGWECIKNQKNVGALLKVDQMKTLPALSSRILQVKPSPTVSLNAKAAEMVKAGKPVISLAVGEPDFPTPQIVVEAAIASLHQGRTKYGAAGGGIELRKAISEKLERENHLKYTPDQIVVGIGAKEILFHLMLSLLNEGDEVLIPAPYWVSYADQVIASGGVPVVVPVPDDFTSRPLSVELIKQYATPRTVAFLLNSPNNPAGYVLGESDLKALGEYLRTTHWWIISDEIYEYLSFSQPHVSFISLFPDLMDRFILINGFSKSFSMTGWRVGYGAGPLSVMKLVRSLQSHSSTCLPGFIEDAAVVAIQEGFPLVENQIKALDQRRKQAYSELSKIPGVQLREPEGAFYVFLDLRQLFALSSGRKEMTSMQFAEMLLNEFYLAAVPGEAFGAPGFLRLSYAVNEEKLLQGIERVRQAVKKIMS
jgi:aspartate aminotransferase